MKGCLFLPFKFLVLVVLFLFFTGVINSFIGPESPLSLEKNPKDLTKEERREIIIYREKEMFHFGNSISLAFPVTILTTYLIFREKKKGRGDQKTKS